MTVQSLVDSRLLLITGKGGTGKSTLSAALGRHIANQDRSTIIVEVDSHRPSLTEMFGVQPTYEPVNVGRNLDICNVTWKEALTEWLERTVPVQRIVRLIMGNRIVQVFINATPGVRETVILSRIATLCEMYDTVVVDMPASGHAVSLVRVPHIALDLMASGPIRERSEQVIALFGEPTTNLVIVCLPEEMIVNETIELWTNLKEVQSSLRIPNIVLNRSVVPSMTDDERQLLERLNSKMGDDEAVRDLLLAGRWEAELESATATANERLSTELNADVIHISRLGALGGMQGGAKEVVRQFAAAIARKALVEVKS